MECRAVIYEEIGMITRIRVEAEGSSTQEVEDILNTAHEVIVNEANRTQLAVMFGYAYSPSQGTEGDYYPGLADSQAGEFVIERFARESLDEEGKAEVGHGGIVYRGRSVAHFARPQNLRKLNRRDDRTDPYSEV